MKQFSRCKEDFVCENCGHPVKGNGYTNHCPLCLFSKHVDVNPGDRLAHCAGLMRPFAVVTRQSKYRIVHRCDRCGFEKTNDADDSDSFDALLDIARQSH